LELQQPGEIEKRLGKLPKDLKLAYDEIYNRMTEHERKIADRAFQWVMCAAKPLSTQELLPALCQDGTGDTLLPLDGLDEELALEYCHNLLVIDPVRKVWVPSHLSVIEYIEEHLWSQCQANSLISSVCLLALQNTVLCNREEKWIMSVDVRPDPLDLYWDLRPESNLLPERNFDPIDPLDHWEFIFLSFYARHHWAIHAKRSADKGSNHRMSTLVDEFLGLPAYSSPAYRCWMRMVTEEDKGGLPLTSIFGIGI
jgi:ankyrin repeat domain-containing protein 50